LVGDIRTFESDVTFDSAYVYNSTMAYFIDDNDFDSALSNIHNLIKTGGLFIFDYFYPINMLKQNKYERKLHQNKSVNGLTLEKSSEHKIDRENQIHREKSKYILTDGTTSRVFYREEKLRYYEPEQITGILKQIGFSDVFLFDRDTYTHLNNSTTGIYVVAKK
jgi:SAM-dependent methyltransferase